MGILGINKLLLKFGMRPVHMAACYGHRDAVDSLLRAGATVTAVDKVRIGGRADFLGCESMW